ncbi:MAG: peptidase M15 [Bacteroidales bacterium]|nr:peptidase M15 [Bacteroidales bacterium]
MYGESRIIVGAHWQSDVDASRLAGAIGLARLHTSPEFLAQLTKAQNEFKRLKGKISPTDDASQFVELAEAIPDVILEIRYYSTYNFLGAKVDGYQEPITLITRQAADSLRAVSDELLKQGYRLKIFDAYRPQCAVDHFMRWGADITDTLMKPYFYPDVPRDKLFELEYIAEHSSHTRGSTVDLTLFDMRTEKEVDMGGTFDWFGRESHPDFGGNPETGEYQPNNHITAEQFRNRMILRRAMLRHGFKPYPTEWWHFTLKNEPFPDTYFTFPVKKLDD